MLWCLEGEKQTFCPSGSWWILLTIFQKFPWGFKTYRHCSSPAKTQTAPCLPGTSSMPSHICIPPYHPKPRQILHVPLSMQWTTVWSWCFEQEDKTFWSHPTLTQPCWTNITQLWFDFERKCWWTSLHCPSERKEKKKSKQCMLWHQAGTKHHFLLTSLE